MGLLSKLRGMLPGGRQDVDVSQLATAVQQAFDPEGGLVYRDDLRESNPWMYAANRQVAGRGSRTDVELRMQSIDRRGGRAEVREDPVRVHPFLDLVGRPNPDETGLVFHWRQLLQLQTVGKCYQLVIPSRVEVAAPGDSQAIWSWARIDQIRLLPPDRVTAYPAHGRAAGEFAYRPSGKDDQVFRAPPFSRDERAEWRRDPYPFIARTVVPAAAGYGVDAPAAAARVALKTLDSLGRMHWQQLKNGVHAGLIFYLLSGLGDDMDIERFKQAVVMIKAGIGKAGEPAVFPEELVKVEPSPVTNDRMRFTDLADLSRRETLAVLGASEAVLGLADNVNRANLWALEYLLAVGTIDPLNALLADTYNAWILPLFPGQSDSQKLVVDFSSARLADETSKVKETIELVKAKLLTQNEARDTVGYGPHPSEHADELPPNSGPSPMEELQSVVDGQQDDADADQDRGRSYEPGWRWRMHGHDLRTSEGRGALWRQLVQRTFAREVEFAADLRQLFDEMAVAVLDALDQNEEQLLAPRSIPGLWDSEEWAARLMRSFEANVSKTVKESLEAAYLESGLGDAFTVQDAVVAEYIAGRGAEFVSNVNDTTRAHLQSIMQEAVDEGWGVGKTSREIRKKFEEFSKKRADTIARTEINAAENWSRARAYRQAAALGVPLKEMWITARDSRVRPTHEVLDGVVRSVTELFEVGGCQMEHPQDGERCALAEEIINCRCRLVAITQIG